MAWAVAAALVDPRAGDCVIDSAESVTVSYPGFFDDLSGLIT
jgi:5-enolpyruvylshikimate-3-phosphate synthase